jgi:hypothetical protein
VWQDDILLHLVLLGLLALQDLLVHQDLLTQQEFLALLA